MQLKLCLNSIVKNESERIERMLDSVKDHIATFAILDTGSTDDTVERIRLWAERNEIKGIIGHGTFIDFSQARNQALDLARSWWRHPDAPKFTYLLLCDADMELRVEDPHAFDRLTGASYYIAQRAGATSYMNTRVVHVSPEFKYVGVTHEYLDAPSNGPLSGVHFVDHADGANRPEKYERDIRLLTEDLERDPNNGRSWFYLANTYRDAGEHDKAIVAYRRRVEIGGWDEETWNAKINIANCLEKQGLEDAYVHEALEAYQYRPTRAEPLHALAKHYRMKGKNAAAVLFAEAGLNIKRPDDLLFVEDWVYDWGFRDEFAISGYYNERTRPQAFRMNNSLALDPAVPEYIRHSARRNMAFYLKPLKDFCPSAVLHRLSFAGNPGFTSMNPSITNRPDGSMEVLCRTVNYTINEAGQYMIGEKGCWDAPIVTENWLLALNEELAVTGAVNVKWSRPAPKFDKVIGLEDMRIGWHADGSGRYFSACVREQSEIGTCEQWSGQLDDDGTTHFTRAISDPNGIEKNWLRWKDLTWVYRLDKIIDIDGSITKTERNVAVDNISGSSQWIDFNGGRLSVVHEAIAHPSHGKRVYQHRFAWVSDDFQTLKLSLPFVFRDVQIEFCAGIAKHPDGRLVMSFGIRDAEAWLCAVNSGEVMCMLAS